MGAYLVALTGHSGLLKGSHGFGNFAEMLRIASNFKGLTVHGSSEPVLFSQRGLNTVIIAFWCASRSSCLLEVIERLIYIGGDADTIGAVAGQLAGPVLAPTD